MKEPYYFHFLEYTNLLGVLFLVIRTVGPFVRFIPLTWYFEFHDRLLGECHCWKTSESPRAHVAKFYGRLRLIRSVWRVSKFSVFKLDWNCNFVDLWHHPFWLQLHFGTFLVITFQILKLQCTCLAQDPWRGFSTRNTQMVHNVYLIQ